MSYVLVVLGLLALCATTVWLIEGIYFAFKPGRIEFARTRVQRGLGALVVGLILLPIGASMLPEKPKDAATIAAEKVQEERCRQDSRCWGDKFTDMATLLCRPKIEALALYEYKWTNFGEVFSEKPRWKDLEKDVIIYSGSAFYAQNAFGAMGRYRYQCEYSTKYNRVVDLRAEPYRAQ